MLDADVQALNCGFDRPELFEKAISALRAPDRAALAQRVLARYVPEGPGSAAADEWQAWYQTNRPYLFFSEWGGYRWYVDPLAKNRHIPTADLRGPQRADKSP